MAKWSSWFVRSQFSGFLIDGAIKALHRCIPIARRRKGFIEIRDRWQVSSSFDEVACLVISSLRTGKMSRFCSPPSGRFG